jgi:hypothetical protein
VVTQALNGAEPLVLTEGISSKHHKPDNTQCSASFVELSCPRRRSLADDKTDVALKLAKNWPSITAQVREVPMLSIF